MDCIYCGEEVLPDEAGSVKTENDDIVHSVCKTNSPPEVSTEVFDPTRPHIDNLYNCGHIIYAPESVVPLQCPECKAPRIKPKMEMD